MLPEAKTDDLLYVTNVYTVTVYTYPSGKHVGTIKLPARPELDCSDSVGDVFVGDGDIVYEYAHGGKKPIATFTDSGYLAAGCASDPTTGNLAVAWDEGFSNGYIDVYPGAKGSPVTYSYGNLLPDQCGYDNKGNLYADGIVEDVGIEFVELPKGASSLQALSLNQSFGGPGSVQWDGKYLAIGDDSTNEIYRFMISGSSGTLEGSTSLGGLKEDVVQWWIQGKTVIGAEGEPSNIFYWDYPTGGNPTKDITKAVFAPAGVTVSLAKK